MKIIRKPKYQKLLKCDNCGCEFEIDDNDIRQNSLGLYKGVKIPCPLCRNDVYVGLDCELEDVGD